MKKTLLLSTILFIGLAAFSQETKKRASPHDTLRAKDLSVTYGRPYKKGREIFGKLEPYGKVYRCGADEATQITFKKDVTFGGKPVKAGTYTLFVIPEEKEWTIILNSKLGQWGAYDYLDNKNNVRDQDVLKTMVPVKTLSAPVEQLTIARPASGLSIAWDKTEVVVPIKG